MKRSDYETPPTVVGKIKRAWIGNDEHPDILHIEIIDADEDIGNLLQVIGDDKNPDPKRPICMIGLTGTLANRHGYSSEKDLIGKHCVIFSGGRFDTLAIEPMNKSDHWGLVIWTEYV